MILNFNLYKNWIVLYVQKDLSSYDPYVCTRVYALNNLLFLLLLLLATKFEHERRFHLPIQIVPANQYPSHLQIPIRTNIANHVL